MGNTPKQVRYRQQYVRCGKPQCGRCSAGPGHGPYWYAIWRDGDHVRTRYVGKQLPPDVSTTSLHGDLTQLAPVGTALARRAQLAANALTAASAQPRHTNQQHPHSDAWPVPGGAKRLTVDLRRLAAAFSKPSLENAVAGR